MKVDRDSLTIRNEGVLQYIELEPLCDIKRLLELVIEDELENGVNISSVDSLKDSIKKLIDYGFIKSIKDKKSTYRYCSIDYEVLDIPNIKKSRKSKVLNDLDKSNENLETKIPKEKSKSELIYEWVNKQSDDYLIRSTSSKAMRDCKTKVSYPLFNKIYQEICKARGVK